MRLLTSSGIGSWLTQWKGHFDEYRLMARAFLRDIPATLSLLLIILFILAAVFAPYLTPYPEQGKGMPNMDEKLEPPSRRHPLGTDDFGRDVLARLLFGGRSSMTMGASVAIAAILIGMPIGTIAGYFGGWVDETVMRITDVFLSFPPLLLAVAITAALGPSFTNAMIALSFTWWPWYTRLARAQALSLKERCFIEAARAAGTRHHVIMMRHIVPNLVAPILVQGTTDCAAAILVGATLAFLGLGAQPPTPDWGNMISVGRQFLLHSPWFATYAGLALFLVALAFNLLGDGIRDMLDPRTRRS